MIGQLSHAWQRLRDYLSVQPGRSPELEELLSKAPVPMLWLYGKTGSGKTSIIRYLTGAADAEIGSGFRPQTQFSRLFSFPEEELPLVRFLDTRGIGEAAYDPTDDLHKFDDAAHLIIVTVRATDHATDEIVKPFQRIRKARPQRPVLLVLTALHDAYPGKQHPEPYPFEDQDLASAIPDDLRRSLAQQHLRWSGLYDRSVAIDLTPSDDGFTQPNYGGQQLKQAILRLLPAAYSHTLIEMDRLQGEFREIHHRQTQRTILTHSIIAASAAAVPVPWIDIPVVMAVQSHLAHRLAALNRQPLDAHTLAHVTSAVGSRIALRMGIREGLKFLPWVGVAANAASAFAFTFAFGWAWNWYFVQVKSGHIPTANELREIYEAQLRRGAELWQSTHGGTFS